MACAAHERPSLAQLGLDLRNVCGPRPGPARPGASVCGGDVTGAREAVWGRARRVLIGAWTMAWPSSRCRRRHADGTAARGRHGCAVKATTPRLTRRRHSNGVDGEAWTAAWARMAHSYNDVQTPAVGGGVRTAALSAGAFMAWARAGTQRKHGVWQTHGENVLTGRPGGGSGGWQVGPSCQRFPNSNVLPDENS
jgi:hypothetical protein